MTTMIIYDEINYYLKTLSSAGVEKKRGGEKMKKKMKKKM